MKKYLNIYKIGVIVLLVALAVNIVTALFGFMNWYQFIGAPGTASLINVLWLFVGYPFCLGLTVVILFRPRNSKKH